MISGRVEGDENIEIRGFAKIEEAKPGDITFIANPKYGHFIHSTKPRPCLYQTISIRRVPKCRP